MKRAPDNAAAPAVANPLGCSWVSDRPCRFPAPFSHNTNGGPWWCPWHFRCNSHAEGAKWVDASYRWDGMPQSYLAARAKEVYGKPEPKPEEKVA